MPNELEGIIDREIAFHIEAIGTTYGKDSLQPIIDVIKQNLAQAILDAGYIKKSEVRVDEELIEALDDMVNQHCQVSCSNEEKKITLDSMALTSNADAMRLLAKLGKIKIIKEYSSRGVRAEKKW